jgi:hypothetical protein
MHNEFQYVKEIMRFVLSPNYYHIGFNKEPETQFVICNSLANYHII